MKSRTFESPSKRRNSLFNRRSESDEQFDNRHSTHLILFKLLLAFLLSVIFVLSAADGLRGSDQYWYIADIETLKADKEPTTNHYFPGPLLRSETESFSEAPANYFLHNGPILRIVEKLSSLFSAKQSTYRAWIALNLFCHLIVALALFLICQKLKLYSLEVTTIYLLSPIAIWQSSNILSEVFFSSLLAIIVACYVYLHIPLDRYALRKSQLFHTGIVAVLSLSYVAGVLSHPLFFVLAMAYFVFLVSTALNRPADSILQRSQVGSRSVFRISAATLFIVAVFFLRSQTKTWFPTMYQGSIFEFKVRALPDVSSMLLYQSYKLQTLNLEIVFSKLLYAVKAHFFAVTLLPFTIITNVGIVAYLFLCVVAFSRLKYLLLAFGVIYSAYGAMLILHTFRFGYVQIIAIVSFINIAIALKKIGLREKHIKIATTAVLCIFIGLNIFLVTKSRGDADFDAVRHQQYVDLFKDIDQNSRVMVVHPAKNKQVIPYALRPRDVLEVNLQLLETEQLERLTKLFQPDYVLMNAEPDIPGVKRYKLLDEIEDAKYGKLSLYRVFIDT